MSDICAKSQFALAWLGWLSATFAPPLAAMEFEGYAEPYRTIRVAASESGTIEEVFVREGQTVSAGQQLIKLNCDVHMAVLAIAEQNMLAQGRIDASRAQVQMRRQRFEKLKRLREDGHARQEEVDRAASELAVAEANYRTAREDQLARKLEYEKFKTQLAQRTIRTPIPGIVTVLHKDVGEFVAPNNPDVLTVVQTDKLLVNFTLMGADAAKLRTGQKKKVRFLSSRADTVGVVEFISPVNDAESGTVLVRVRVNNPDGRLRSGERCKIEIGSTP